MWSKGAVVVVKHGDAALSNQMEQGLGFQSVSIKRLESLERDNFFLRRIATRAEIKAIRKAEAVYGKNPKPCAPWLRPLMDIWTLAVYGFSVFVDRYLTIKDVRRH